jgi:DNA ligase (NAD+)
VSDAVHRATLTRLIELGVETTSVQPLRSEGPLQGLSFCVTGQLSAPREEIHALIQARGGLVHTSVKKGTTYLVAGEKVGRTKIEAAERRGAKVIDEATLRAMLESTEPT